MNSAETMIMMIAPVTRLEAIVGPDLLEADVRLMGLGVGRDREFRAERVVDLDQSLGVGGQRRDGEVAHALLLLVPWACTTGRRSEATPLTTDSTCACVACVANPMSTTFPPRKSMPRLNPQKMIARMPGMMTRERSEEEPVAVLDDVESPGAAGARRTPRGSRCRGAGRVRSSSSAPTRTASG